MSDPTIRDEALAECLEDHHRRRARGEPEVLDSYAARLRAEEQAEFRRLLATEEALDALLDPPETAVLPRPFGPYTLLRELGRGAMGVVYEAIHRELGRTVALKVLRAGVDVDQDARARFRREARACAQVRHPNIVEIYEAGEIAGQPYYAMELVAGRPLSDLAKEGKYKDSRALFRGIAGIADALAALHAAGIVHRDVKPSNVIVDAEGRMFLADFGLARSLTAERMTATGVAIGTPLYMSPEQVMGRGDAIDGRSDVYSLGAALYDVLAGRGPFRSDDPMTMLRMVLKERPDPLASVAPSVPAAACAVVMKALEKRPEDRYASAAALRDDLVAHAEGRKVEGRPVSDVTHAARSARRFVPAGIAAAALLAVGVYAYSTRPAKLTVRSVPSAEVVIDGVARGMTPQVDLKIGPGEHTLELVKEGWTAEPMPLVVEAGDRPSFQLVLLPENADDPEALKLLGEQIGLAVAELSTPRARTKAEGDPVWAVFPRGRVRLADLDRLRVDVTDEFEPGGKLVFLRRGETLASLPFDPTEPMNDLPFPADVRKTLAAGDTVEWGYVAPSGQRFVASIDVVEDVCAAKLAQVGKLCAGKPLVRRNLEAQVLIESGLDYAAYRAAADAARVAPKSERAWAVMEASLVRLGLSESRPWVDATKGRDAAGRGE